MPEPVKLNQPKVAEKQDWSYFLSTMRECLGWLTNCEEESRCPQNWLERSVTEIPSSVSCDVCGQIVQLVTSVPSFKEQVAANVVSALPVVPCANRPAIHSLVGSNSGGSSPQPPSPPPIEEVAPVALNLYCILSNGDRIKCDKDTMIVGRSRTCDIVLPSAKVSRQHASVVRAGDQWTIEDMGSANGVWINGERIAQAVVISDGDIYTVSDETLTFQYR